MSSINLPSRLALIFRRPGAGPPPAGYRWTALTNTTIGAFMASLDASILTVSLPTIANQLHTGVGLMLWILMGYTVVITALLLPMGRLADLHGRVKFYLAGFIIFTVGSLLSGLAQTGDFLLVARLIQGSGAALLWSNSTAILTDAFPADGRGLALGINQVAAIAGSVGGLVLGGLITATLGWRWIFFVNLPIGTAGALWTYFRLREVGRRAKHERFDPMGSALFTAALVLVLLGLTRIIGGDYGPTVELLILSGLALFVVFVVAEQRHPSPMMDFSLLRIRLFTFGNASLLLNAIARGALMFLLTFAFQGLLGAGPLKAGLMIMPFSITILVVGPIAGTLSDRVGARGLSTIGLLISAVGLYGLAILPLTGPYSPIAFGLVVTGLGTGMFNAPNTASVMASVPADRRGVAASMRSLVFNTGQLLSIAISFVIVSAAMGAGQLEGFLAGTNATGASSHHAAAFAAGLRGAFVVAAFLSVIGAGLSFMRGDTDGSNEPPPKPRAGRSAPTV